MDIKALAGMVYKFFDKKTGLVVNVNEVLAQELYKIKIQKKKSLCEVYK